MARAHSNVLFFLLGLIIAPLLALLYLAVGKPPVAVADDPFPLEGQIVQIPLAARIHREMPKTIPIEATDQNLIAGAGIYQDKCAICHGSIDESSAFASSMFPRPPQLWKKRGNGVVEVSDDPAPVTFWKVQNGIRLSGMPAYGKALTETQIWQVSLLLSRADKPLPAEATDAVAH